MFAGILLSRLRFDTADAATLWWLLVNCGVSAPSGREFSICVPFHEDDPEWGVPEQRNLAQTVLRGPVGMGTRLVLLTRCQLAHCRHTRTIPTMPMPLLGRGSHLVTPSLMVPESFWPEIMDKVYEKA